MCAAAVVLVGSLSRGSGLLLLLSAAALYSPPCPCRAQRVGRQAGRQAITQLRCAHAVPFGRRDAGPRAEGEGYWLIAEAAKVLIIQGLLAVEVWGQIGVIPCMRRTSALPLSCSSRGAALPCAALPHLQRVSLPLLFPAAAACCCCSGTATPRFGSGLSPR